MRWFSKDRSVSQTNFLVPIYYTNIPKPGDRSKKVVIMRDLGNHYSASWRNYDTMSNGPSFLLKKTNTSARSDKNQVSGFIMKGKTYSKKELYSQPIKEIL